MFLFVLPVLWLVFSFNQPPPPPVYGRPTAAPSQLENILSSGVLRVATRVSSLTYFKNEEGKISGLDADLCSLFAARLGVRVEFIVAESIPEIYELLRKGEVDIAAAGLIRDPEQHPQFRFGSSYLQLRQQLLMRDDIATPSNLDDISNAYISVLAGSGQADTARGISEQHPDIVPQALQGTSSMDLVSKLARKELDYVLIDSSMAHWAQKRFPEIKLAFDIGEPKDYAWVFARRQDTCAEHTQESACKNRDDDSLILAANDFLSELKRQGELQRMIDGYFDYFDTLDPDGARQFLRAVRYQLADYRAHFIQAGNKYDMDWRLIAATGYQESKWDPQAVSSSGVRGMMQFTAETAQKMGINPHDPQSSINGAARYIKLLDQQLPRNILPKERPWFALAAYNIGIGTLLNALRQHARKHSNTTLYWSDFKDTLLADSQGSSFTRQRRQLALNYVDSIRNYYELLIWLTERSPELSTAQKNSSLP
jgi:membrane-bound lytic murein transglycosylase F